MAYADNPKSYFDYEILEKIEAGIVLGGHETKAIKAGKASIRGAYIKILNNEAYLVGAIISPYQAGNVPKDYDEQKNRKLLLSKKELRYLIDKSEEKGLTLVPVKLYAKGGLIKLEIAIAKGKKQYDKRESIKKREVEKTIKRKIKATL